MKSKKVKPKKIDHYNHGKVLDERPPVGYYLIRGVKGDHIGTKFAVKGRKPTAGITVVHYEPTGEHIDEIPVAKLVKKEKKSKHTRSMKNPKGHHHQDSSDHYQKRRYYKGRIYTISPKGHYGLIRLYDGQKIVYLSNKKHDLYDKVWFHIIPSTPPISHKKDKDTLICVAINVTSKKPSHFSLFPYCEEPLGFVHKGLHGTVIDEEPDFNNYKEIEGDNNTGTFVFQGAVRKDEEVGFVRTGDFYQGKEVVAVIHIDEK